MTPEQEKEYSDVLDRFYNQGVGHAVEIVKVFLYERPELSEQLVIELEKLKKKDNED
jgi:hypothetical protein